MGIKLLLRARNRLVPLRENWYKVSNDALPGLRVLFQRLLCWQVWKSEATRPAWIAHKTFSPHKIMALRRKGADCTSSSFLERQVPTTTVVEGKFQVKLMPYTRGNSRQAIQVRALVKGKLNLFYIGANCQSYLTTDCVEWETEPTSSTKQDASKEYLSTDETEPNDEGADPSSKFQCRLGPHTEQ